MGANGAGDGAGACLPDGDRVLRGMQFGVLFGCLKVRWWLLAVLFWRRSEDAG